MNAKTLAQWEATEIQDRPKLERQFSVNLADVRTALTQGLGEMTEEPLVEQIMRNIAQHAGRV